jgi:hypothetical protein
VTSAENRRDKIVVGVVLVTCIAAAAWIVFIG